MNNRAVFRAIGESPIHVHQISVPGMKRCRMVALCAMMGLSSCSASLSVEQRYVGTLSGCAAPQTATLVLRRKTFAFTPDTDSPLVVRGSIGQDGTIKGELNTQPPGKPPYLLTVTGALGPRRVSVSYVTPRCTAAGQLDLRPKTLLP